MTQRELRDLVAPVSRDKGNELPPSQWEQLQEGHYVLVQREDEPLRVGEVDVLTQDAAVFWVWLDGGRGRIAVYADEGTCVWLPSGYRVCATEEFAGEPVQHEAP